MSDGLDRLSRDLRYFKQELERENDPMRRNLILTQIRNIEQRLLNIMVADRERIERENKNMEEALRRIRERERDRDRDRDGLH